MTDAWSWCVNQGDADAFGVLDLIDTTETPKQPIRPRMLFASLNRLYMNTDTKIGETACIFVGNLNCQLPDEALQSALQSKFDEIGDVEYVTIYREQQHRPSGFVHFHVLLLFVESCPHCVHRVD